jgi:hypothetical protein
MGTLLDLASLVVVPSGYKEDKIYSVVPTDGSGDLDFTRASNATRVNSAGLIEKVRENLILQSNTFDTTWANTRSTDTSGQVGYDGTSNAWLLESTASPANEAYIRQTITASGSNTFSIYAKAGTSNFIAFYIDATVGADPFAFFNLSTGAVGSTSATATASIVSVGSGWYRCSAAFNASIQTIDVYVTDADGSFNSTLGANIVIQNSQLETGDIATDYIPTTTAAVSVGMTADVPRLDYLGSSCPKLLLEPQTTALNQFSEQLNNAYWSLSRASAFGSGSVVNAVVAPDGTQSAEYVQQASGQTTGGGALVGILSATGNYTISVFAKMAEQRYLRLGGTLGAGGAGLFCNFDLQNGVTGTPSSGVTPRIENYGNGWYRCSISASKVDLTGNLVFLYQANTLNGSDATPLSGLYLWGANVTQMAYPTSYIPTLGTSVTRVADAASKTGISSLIGQTEGTLFAEVVYNGNASGTSHIIHLDQNTTSSVFILRRTNGNIEAAAAVGGVAFGQVIGGNIVAGSTFKIAYAYKSGSSALYINGVQIGTNAQAFAFTQSLSAIRLNDPTSLFSVQQNVSFDQALLFKTRLSNTELAQLTTL